MCVQCTWPIPCWKAQSQSCLKSIKVLDLYMKTTWGNLTHDNNDGDDDTFALIACFNAIIVAC